MEKIFHVISNTHWDREWRFSFQRNRQMLVDMIDEVIHILEKEPDYRAFHLDSQTVVVEDYLEAKPQMEERFINLVKEKRLFIGPWYILPEEFQVGGENLIRNLIIGHKLGKKFGSVSKIGYSPFSWGQISQLPQLYREFGVNLIMFYRGINSLDSPKAEFIWIGADGTKAISSRFSTMPRYNFYFYVYRPVIHNEGFYDIEYKWQRGGTPFHFIDSELVHEDYFVIDPNETYYKENIEKSVNNIIKDQADDFTTPHVTWMEGHDSSGPNIKTVNILKDIQTIFPNLNVIHSTLENYASSISNSVDETKLKTVEGERRSAQFDRRSGNLYGYTTSARMYLKIKNFENEKWLQYYAEPFETISGIEGKDTKSKYLEIAWKLLVQNSAHDSIGGCSLDEIHEDMMNRYKHSIEISQGVFERAIKYIVKKINTSSISLHDTPLNNHIFIAAFNPNNYSRNEVVETFIDIPVDLDNGGINLFDGSGNIPIQLLEISDVQPVLEQMIDRPMYFNFKRYKAAIQLNNVPHFGFKVYNVIPSFTESKSDLNLLKKSSNNIDIENDTIKLKINSNGTFNLKFKSTNKIYKNLGYFYDEGEKGHAWVNSPLPPYVTTLKSKPSIKVIGNGPLKTTCLIKHNLKIPKDLKNRLNKSFKTVNLKIDFYLTVKKDSDRIEFKIIIDNTAESHRLRIMFPTELNSKFSHGEGQFDVVRRNIEREETKDWVEQPMYDYPMHYFVDISDENNGLAILANGLKEYEILNDKKRTMAITLLRGFQYIIIPSSKEDYTHQKGSQCLGKQLINFALLPHKGNWESGKVFEHALNYSNDIRLVQFGSTNGTQYSRETTFIKVEPEELIISTFKKSEHDDDITVLRLYNPTNKTIAGNINTIFFIKSAWITNIEEVIDNPVKLNNNFSIPIIVESKKILTIKLITK